MDTRADRSGCARLCPHRQRCAQERQLVAQPRSVPARDDHARCVRMWRCALESGQTCCLGGGGGQHGYRLCPSIPAARCGTGWHAFLMVATAVREEGLPMSGTVRKVAAGALLACFAAGAHSAAPPPSKQMDRDLLEVTIPQLHRYYAEHRYNIAQVVEWHLDRIERYNGIYRAVEQVFAEEARANAAREDGDKAAAHGPLWGVPIVIKANTSIEGKVTTDGWEGFTIPGHELVAPRDATVVAKLRAAGAIILGHTHIPDFAT